MALAIDASTPAPILSASLTTVTSLASNSFTPPVGSILVILYGNGSDNGGNGQVTSITDSLGTHLTYTKQVSSVGPNPPANASVWTSTEVLSSVSMTCTLTISPTDTPASMAYVIIVFTGAATTQAGNHSSGSSASGTPSSGNLASAASTSWIVGAMGFGGSGTSPTPGTGQTNSVNGHSMINTNTGDIGFGQIMSAAGSSHLAISDTAPTGVEYAAVAYEVQAAAGAAAATPLRAQPWPQAMFRSAYR